MKKLATWLLAAAFTTAALPAFAVEPSVQVGYSPEGSARVLVLSAIDSAKTSIRMMAYSFTAPRSSRRERRMTLIYYFSININLFPACSSIADYLASCHTGMILDLSYLFILLILR